MKGVIHFEDFWYPKTTTALKMSVGMSSPTGVYRGKLRFYSVQAFKYLVTQSAHRAAFKAVK
jgi:hypothetical protein